MTDRKYGIKLLGCAEAEADRAKKYAKDNGLVMYHLITLAVKKYMDEAEHKDG
jgi:hypothetical protein